MDTTFLPPELRSAFLRECARRQIDHVTGVRQALINWLGHDDADGGFIDFDEPRRSRPRQRRRTLEAPEVKA